MPFKKGYIPWNKGKKLPPFSDEHKRKIGEASKGRKCPYVSLRNKSKENIEKQRKAMTGKKHTEEAKKKMSETRIGKFCREKSPTWQGGKSFELYGFDFTKELKTLIRKRDDFTCQIPECRKHQKKRAFPVHHIDYDKKNCDPKNLITLCISCHVKTNFNREYWINYFNAKICKLIEGIKIPDEKKKGTAGLVC